MRGSQILQMTRRHTVVEQATPATQRAAAAPTAPTSGAQEQVRVDFWTADSAAGAGTTSQSSSSSIQNPNAAPRSATAQPAEPSSTAGVVWRRRDPSPAQPARPRRGEEAARPSVAPAASSMQAVTRQLKAVVSCNVKEHHPMARGSLHCRTGLTGTGVRLCSHAELPSSQLQPMRTLNEARK